MKLATLLVKVSDTVPPGTYSVSGAGAYLYSNGTVAAEPGPSTVTVTVEPE